MARPKRPQEQTGTEVARSQPRHLLLVDPQPEVLEQLDRAVKAQPVTVIQVATIREARAVLRKRVIDVALIDASLNDGLKLAREVRDLQPATHTIMLSEQPTVDQAVAALQAGAADFVIKPFAPTDIRTRLGRVLSRRDDYQQLLRRVRRLRRVCRKLNEAREQVTKQVDVLCNDLVTAYQELAGQMQQVVHTSEFAAAIDRELDLEHLLRKTLEFLLSKGGPTNAALFLPGVEDDYSVGAYVNYDVATDSIEVLLQHLGDVVAPRVADADGVLHLESNAATEELLGDDAAYLADCHTVGFATRQDDEVLAVIVLFRDGSEPFSRDLLEAAGTVSAMLGQYLGKIIRIHHRHLPDPEDYDDDADDNDNAQAA